MNNANNPNDQDHQSDSAKQKASYWNNAETEVLIKLYIDTEWQNKFNSGKRSHTIDTMGGQAHTRWENIKGVI